MKPSTLILLAFGALGGGTLAAWLSLADGNEPAPVPELAAAAEAGEVPEVPPELERTERRPVALDERRPLPETAEPPAAATEEPAETGQERQRRLRLAERERTEAAEIRRRATIVANELALPTGSEERLAEVFLAERQKLGAARDAYRAAPRTPDSRAEFRSAIAAVGDWRNGELEARFGPELARKVVNASDRSWGLEDTPAGEPPTAPPKPADGE